MAGKSVKNSQNNTKALTHSPMLFSLPYLSNISQAKKKNTQGKEFGGKRPRMLITNGIFPTVLESTLATDILGKSPCAAQNTSQ